MSNKTDFGSAVNKPLPDDDIYPGVNEGNGLYYPQTPAKEKQEQAAEAAKEAANYPVIAEVYEWFDEQIKNCPDIRNIQIDATTINGVKYERNVHVEAQVLAYQLLQTLLEEKRDEFKEFAKEQDE